MTFQFSQLAREERVHLISMPVGVAHILNPLDEELASSLENSIEKKARKYETENPGAPFSQKAFAHILQKVSSFKFHLVFLKPPSWSQV